ncbi:enolase [Mycoplasmoides fastidiosum]|uniref:Enolase n=1 Tax=Mycoplasmoides fastidiosum TaxID=92758 RepID=A0ABU0LZ99_9BACT|nr:enolase [Mycoplasmoides fastidiosum]UUD37558.1 phosphopyruvate hydratase [Mycoplasmoides fastidiosum]
MTIRIKKIFAYEVLDSRGYPTVAVLAKVTASEMLSRTKEASGKVMVPSGASTGQKEALELRDGDKTRYNGKGVKKAIMYINNVLGPNLIRNGVDPLNQEELDRTLVSLDGTENKSQYGANAILGVSLAIAKAVANVQRLPFYRYVNKLLAARTTTSANNNKLTMPVPMVNVINGGEHADNTIDFQEFMFMPIGAHSMHEAVRMASECFHALQSILHSKGYNTNKGDEGGFAPNLRSSEEALSLMVQAVLKAKYKPGVAEGQIAFALDCAASELYDKKERVYTFKKALSAGLMSKKEAVKTSQEMIDYLVSLVNRYPIISIEDPLDETDWDGFEALVAALGNRVQIVGDDLFCTNPKITAEGVTKNLANAVLVKVNQIGTLSETLETIRIAKNAGWTYIISHRSGETEDTTIADIAVGTNAGQIKTGSMSRSERIAKYNRLLEIEMELGRSNCFYPGLSTFSNLDQSLLEEKNYNQALALEASREFSTALITKPTRTRRASTKPKRSAKKARTLSAPLVEAVEVVELPTVSRHVLSTSKRTTKKRLTRKVVKKSNHSVASSVEKVSVKKSKTSMPIKKSTSKKPVVAKKSVAAKEPVAVKKSAAAKKPVVAKKVEAVKKSTKPVAAKKPAAKAKPAAKKAVKNVEPVAIVKPVAKKAAGAKPSVKAKTVKVVKPAAKKPATKKPAVKKASPAKSPKKAAAKK